MHQIQIPNIIKSKELDEVEQLLKKRHRVAVPAKFIVPEKNCIQQWQAFVLHFNKYQRSEIGGLNQQKKAKDLLQFIPNELKTQLKAKNVDIDNYRTSNGIQIIINTFFSKNRLQLNNQNLFFTSYQKKNVTIYNYYKSLTKLLTRCNFDGFEESLLCEQLFYGMQYDDEREILFREWWFYSMYYSDHSDSREILVHILEKEKLNKVELWR